jgi:hypothetical protein
MTKRFPFTWAAAGLGLILALVLALGGGTDAPEARGLPVLSRLFITEFGFLVTAAGAFWGFKHRRSQGAVTATAIAAFACIALAIAFLLMGIVLWTDTMGSASTAANADPTRAFFG